MTDEGDNYNAWTPKRPDGDGWSLVAVFDTEDGPACWWMRDKPFETQRAEGYRERLDNSAVEVLAMNMKAKLAGQRSKGYRGWNNDCTQQHLSDLLRQCVEKGDPVDVANFCAFLLARGEVIAPQAQAEALDALKPDMFWNADEPESAETSINNVVVEADSYRGLKVGDEVQIQRAVALPDLTVRITMVPDSEGNGDLQWDEVDAAIASPAPPSQQCTCPSGDGSLRWPCPAHPPTQERKPMTDGEILEAQKKLIAAKDELYQSRIGLTCSHCKTGKYRADGNGYHEFHRCNKCRHVPMWNLDGTEFNGTGAANAD